MFSKNQLKLFFGSKQVLTYAPKVETVDVKPENCTVIELGEEMEAYLVISS